MVSFLIGELRRKHCNNDLGQQHNGGWNDGLLVQYNRDFKNVRKGREEAIQLDQQGGTSIHKRIQDDILNGNFLYMPV